MNAEFKNCEKIANKLSALAKFLSDAQVVQNGRQGLIGYFF